jgi:hypothetical protein
LALLNDANIVVGEERVIQKSQIIGTDLQNANSASPPSPAANQAIANPSVFTISINGPGVHNTFEIIEEEDLEWVEVAIRKIKRALKSTEAKTIGEE